MKDLEFFKKLYERIELEGRGVCPHPMLQEVKYQSDVHWSCGVAIPNTTDYNAYSSETKSKILYEDKENFYLLETKYFSFNNGGGNKNIEYQILYKIINI